MQGIGESPREFLLVGDGLAESCRSQGVSHCRLVAVEAIEFQANHPLPGR